MKFSLMSMVAALLMAGSSTVIGQVPSTEQVRVHYTYAPVSSPAWAGAPVVITNSNLEARDLDNDGVYEVATVVRTDVGGGIGSTGSVDRVNFVGPSDAPIVVNRVVTPIAPRTTAVGTVRRITLARVRGVDSLIVKINTSINNPGTRVDLGPVDNWPAGTLKIGDVITATGTMADPGDPTILVANTAALNTRPEIVIQRPLSAFEGKIIKLVEIDTGADLHAGALMQAETGPIVLDFGPAQSWDREVDPGMHVVAQGAPFRVQDKLIVRVAKIGVDAAH